MCNGSIHCPMMKPIIPKILVTIDSYSYVAEQLAFMGVLDQFTVLVDEFQCLMSDSKFKGRVELEFLHNLRSVNSVCYMSATPIDENYLSLFPDFADVSCYYKLVWDASVLETPNLDMRPYKPKQSSKGICREIIQGYRQNGYFAQKIVNGCLVNSTEIVIFLNEVRSIVSIIEENKLQPDEVNVLCSPSNKYVKDLKRLGVHIGELTTDPYNPINRTFTFVTRASFEGVDFYSTNAFTYIFCVVSLAQLEGFYYKPRVDKDILRAHSKGVICLSACIAGELPVYILQDNLDGARRCLEEYLEIFGKDNYLLEIQNHDLDEEHKVNKALKQLAKEYGLGLVATNDLHYVRRQDAEAQDVLLCLQTGSTVDEPNRMRFPNDQFYLKSYKEMAEKFSDCPEALANTNLIAERCNVELEFGKLLLPEFAVPEGFDAVSYLRHLCEESLVKKYPQANQEVWDRLDFELKIINQMGYACYFLIVWDFIKYCRENEILVGPGRGSAAGSIVAYLLGITNIEPIRYALLFERFLNPERVSMPDIDTDFCYVNRDKVLDYVVRRYGQERVAQIVTYGTLQARAAIRDVGRALGMSYGSVDRVAKMMPKELGITLDKALRISNDLRALYDNDEEVRRLIDLAKSVEGMPRNVGTHAAGVIIAPADLKDYVPLQLGAEGSVITQYDKDKLEGLGLLKMDFLGLRTLTVIGDSIRNIKETTGEVIDIDNIPLDDKKTCKMLCAGDTYGVFQLESKGITKLVVDLAPESFEDLIPLVALYRPGPLGTGMAEDFIAGRHGHRTAEILHPLMEPILKDTYGVILYQEQVMQITSALAGFSLGQADILRRAMGKKKAKELDSMRAEFIRGAQTAPVIPTKAQPRGGIYAFSTYCAVLVMPRSFDALRLLRMTRV